MAKQIKKASLLSEAEKQKLLKKAGNKKPLTQPQNTASSATELRTASRSASKRATEEQAATSTATMRNICLGLALLVLVVFVIAPKPQLLEYHSAGLTTQSIYMPGWFGAEGTILDTNQRAVLAEDEQRLYLCFAEQSKEQCAKYQLRQQQGFIAATMFWVSSGR